MIKLIEFLNCQAHNPKVAGSIPAHATKYIKNSLPLDSLSHGRCLRSAPMLRNFHKNQAIAALYDQAKKQNRLADAKLSQGTDTAMMTRRMNKLQRRDSEPGGEF